jgi:6-phosphofructokinase 2
MTRIVTLTLNPSIDGSSEADVVRHTHKVRISNEHFDPGGGGINVARVAKELGGDALAVYFAGGATGAVLDELVRERGIKARSIPIRDHTRISHTVFERSSGREYRFVPEGPLLSGDEGAQCLQALEDMDFDYIVGSGSLPRGVPDDFYARLAAVVTRKGARFVLDTSGAALKSALAVGGLHLVKPSAGEFEALVGRSLTASEMAEEAQRRVRAGQAEMIAVTRGPEGAILATRDGATALPALAVEVRSAVGAGDSFVSAMTLGLAEGRPPADAFMRGMAAGTAAVLTPGTGLCRRHDVERLYLKIRSRRGSD